MQKLKVGDKLYSLGKEHVITKVGTKYYTIEDGDRINITSLRYENDKSYNTYQLYRTKEEVELVKQRNELWSSYCRNIYDDLKKLDYHRLKQVIDIIQEYKNENKI